MTFPILVTGATGNIGSQVVKQLVAKGVPVRAFVRSREKAAALEGPGVEIALGDLGQPKTIGTALKGIEKVFLLSPGGPRQVEWQGNVVEAAQRAGVKHIVKVAALGTAPDSPLSLARWHAQTEKQIEESGLAYTHLHPHSFMQNFVGMAPMIAQGNLYAPMKDGKISLVDVRDIAAVTVATLTEEGHEGKTYDITGPEALSYAEIAQKLSAVIGKEVTYVDILPEIARQGMLDMGFPEWLADDFIKLYEVFSAGYAAEISPVVAEVAKKAPITFDQFARDYARVFKGG